MLDEVNIKRISGLAELYFLPARAHELGLHPYIGAFPTCLSPHPPRRAVIADGTRSLVNIPTFQCGQGTLSVLRTLRDDVDHPVHRIGAPDRPTRSADHLDALHVLQHHVLYVPKHSIEERCVDAPTVNQDQQGLGELAGKPSNSDRPMMSINASHVHARRQPETLWDPSGCATPDVFLCDDKDPCWGLLNRLRDWE